MIVRRWWEPKVRAVPWAKVAWAFAGVCGGIAFLISMVIVYGTIGDKNDQIDLQGRQIDKQGEQIDQLTAQVDANNEVSSCRSRLTVDINDKLAAHQEAIGTIVVILGGGDGDLGTAIGDLGQAVSDLKTSVDARKAYELDVQNRPDLPCPITPQELNP